MAIRKLSAAYFDQLLWCTHGLKVWKEAHIETYTVYVYNYQHDTSSTSDCHPMLPFTRKRRRIINFEAPLSPYLTHSVSFSHVLTGNLSGGFAGERRKKNTGHWNTALGQTLKNIQRLVGDSEEHIMEIKTYRQGLGEVEKKGEWLSPQRWLIQLLWKV